MLCINLDLECQFHLFHSHFRRMFGQRSPKRILKNNKETQDENKSSRKSRHTSKELNTKI